MTAFWILVAALSLVAMLFVALPPLKFRERLAHTSVEEASDAQAHAAARAPWIARAPAVAAGVAVPLLAVPLYLALGNPAALSPQPPVGQHGIEARQIDAMVGRLAARLERNPQDGEGWILAARSLATLGRFDEASSAFARAVALFPDRAQLLADYADTLAAARGGSLRGEPEQLVDRALGLEPGNPKALALAGKIAFDNKEFGKAVDHWQRLQGSIPAGSEFAERVRASIAEAKIQAAAGVNKRPRAAAAVSGQAR